MVPPNVYEQNWRSNFDIYKWMRFVMKHPVPIISIYYYLFPNTRATEPELGILGNWYGWIFITFQVLKLNISTDGASLPLYKMINTICRVKWLEVACNVTPVSTRNGAVAHHHRRPKLQPIVGQEVNLNCAGAFVTKKDVVKFVSCQ